MRSVAEGQSNAVAQLRLRAAADTDGRLVATANLSADVVGAKRLGNIHFNGLGILIDQLWVH